MVPSGGTTRPDRSPPTGSPSAFYAGGTYLTGSETLTMIPPIELALLLIWGGFFAFWWISALRNRTPIKRAPGWSGFFTCMGVPAGIILIAVTLIAPNLYEYRVLPGLLPLVVIGFLVLFLGIGFAVWARVHLGTNWSSRPAIRENHTITRTGPYAIVRHPIYTGILTGILGTAIATGSLLVFVCLVIILVLFLLKIRMEEQFLLEEFGEEYAQYRREVRALVPWVV
jgi:protein-S-isoprenylcysteine O-methyltransferase Ste14